MNKIITKSILVVFLASLFIASPAMAEERNLSKSEAFNKVAAGVLMTGIAAAIVHTAVKGDKHRRHRYRDTYYYEPCHRPVNYTYVEPCYHEYRMPVRYEYRRPHRHGHDHGYRHDYGHGYRHYRRPRTTAYRHARR